MVRQASAQQGEEKDVNCILILYVQDSRWLCSLVFTRHGHTAGACSEFHFVDCYALHHLPWNAHFCPKYFFGYNLRSFFDLISSEKAVDTFSFFFGCRPRPSSLSVLVCKRNVNQTLNRAARVKIHELCLSMNTSHCTSYQLPYLFYISS